MTLYHGWESGMDNAARFGFIEQDQLKRYADKAYGGDIDKARVRALHERCGGWVVWDDAAGGAVYLPTGDWLARFKEVAGG